MSEHKYKNPSMMGMRIAEEVEKFIPSDHTGRAPVDVEVVAAIIDSELVSLVDALVAMRDWGCGFAHPTYPSTCSEKLANNYDWCASCLARAALNKYHGDEE